MSHCPIDLTVSKVLETFRASSVLDFPEIDGLMDALIGWVHAMATDLALSHEVLHLEQRRGMSYAPALDVVLRRFFIGSPEDFNNPEKVLLAVEAVMSSTDFAVRKEAVNVFAGVKQLAKNVILYKFKDAFGLAVDGPEMAVQFLTLCGLDEDLMQEFVNDRLFKNIMVELYVLTIWSTLIMIQELRRPCGELVSRFYPSVTSPVSSPPPPVRTPQSLDALPRSAPQRAPRVAGVPAVVTPAAGTGQFVSMDIVLAMQQQIADLTAAMSRTTGVPAPPPPVARAPEPFFDSDSDMDEEELDGMAAATQDRAYLAAGSALLTGPALRPAGESVDVSYSRLTSPAAPLPPFAEGPLLRNFLLRARANHSLTSELTMDEVLYWCCSPDGFLMLSVNGLPYSYTVPLSTRGTVFAPKVTTKLFNPDNHPALACLGAPDQSFHLFPATVEQFEANMGDQQLKCMKPSPLFPAATPTDLMKCIFAYRAKVLRLLDGLFGGHSVAVIQAHRHHVTVWSLVLVFHVNRWMRALVQGDIQLLLTGFDHTWQSIYSVQLGLDVRGRPLVQLPDALLLCSYRCPGCGRIGGSALHCPHDACRSSALTLMGSDSSDAQPGYMPAFKAWLKLQPQSTDSVEAHRLFCNTPAAKEKGFLLKPPKAKGGRSQGLSCQDRANEQQHIALHVCPNFSYA